MIVIAGELNDPTFVARATRGCRVRALWWAKDMPPGGIPPGGMPPGALPDHRPVRGSGTSVLYLKKRLYFLRSKRQHRHGVRSRSRLCEFLPDSKDRLFPVASHRAVGQAVVDGFEDLGHNSRPSTLPTMLCPILSKLPKFSSLVLYSLANWLALVSTRSARLIASLKSSR